MDEWLGLIPQNVNELMLEASAKFILLWLVFDQTTILHMPKLNCCGMGKLSSGLVSMSRKSNTYFHKILIISS